MRASWPLRAVAIACAVSLGIGWSNRQTSDLVARTGVGYALGVIGLSQMLLLLGYSLRKRMRWLQGRGPVRTWFEIHLMLGLLGPTAILFHCNFELGSINASVALLSTLFVAGSGIVGRFLYARIHFGLLGERRTIEHLRSEMVQARRDMFSGAPSAASLAKALDRFEGVSLASTPGGLTSLGRVAATGVRSLALRQTVGREFSASAGPHGSAERAAFASALRVYARSASRAALLGVNERLFGLWHAVHLPLCLVLFGSALVHVVAVHMF